MKPRLTIIIVNYRSIQLILDCLATVYAQTVMPFEVIVVDNQSGDGGQALLKERFPQVRWRQMGYNAGFARANNAGIREANGEAVLLLNPDVLIEESAIQQSFERFVDSAYVACGVQLLNRDRTPQITGNFFIRGGVNHLLPLPVLGRLMRGLGSLLKVRKTNIPEAAGTVEVDWINGAYLMVKKEAIQKAGLLDEDFFLYAEEIEWCARLRRQGSLCVYGDLHVVHLQGESANEAFDSAGQGYHNLFDRKGKQILLSNFVRVRKQFGTGWFLVHQAFYLAEVPLFFLYALLWRRKGFRLKEWNGYLRNLFYLLRLSPKIVANRPYFYKV